MHRDIMELLMVYCTLTFLHLTQNRAHGHTADSAKEICHYDIIEGKSPLISNSSEDTWYIYKPSSDAVDTAINSELCDQQCCEDPECNLVVVRRIDSPDNSSYCVIFKCGEAGCQLETNDRYDVHIKVMEVDSNHDTSIVENQVSTKTVAPKNGEESGRTTTVQLDAVVSKHSSMKQGGTTPKYNELLNNSLVTPADSKIGGIDGQHSENSTDASNFTALSLVEDIPSDNGTAHPNKANQTIASSTTKDLSDVVALLNSNDKEENKHNDSAKHQETIEPSVTTSSATLQSTIAGLQTGTNTLPKLAQDIKITTTPPNKVSQLLHDTSSAQTTHHTSLKLNHIIPTKPQLQVINSTTATQISNSNLDLNATIKTTIPADTNSSSTRMTSSKPYIWQVPWWYDGAVNQQHVTLFTLLVMGVIMTLIVAGCIARICVRSWRVKRRTRKGYLFLSRFM